MANVIGTFDFHQRLKAEGYDLPPETVEVRLIVGVDSALQLQILVNVTDEDAIKIGKALVKMGRESFQRG